MQERREVKRLMTQGKERGFLTFDEINEGLPADMSTLEELEDVIALFTQLDIEVVEDAARIQDGASTDDEKPVEFNADAAKGSDPVRMYLRKMGAVSLLTREGEVEIAKRIEAGELSILEAVLGTPFVWWRSSNWAIVFGKVKFELRKSSKKTNPVTMDKLLNLTSQK